MDDILKSDALVKLFYCQLYLAVQLRLLIANCNRNVPPETLDLDCPNYESKAHSNQPVIPHNEHRLLKVPLFKLQFMSFSKQKLNRKDKVIATNFYNQVLWVEIT